MDETLTRTLDHSKPQSRQGAQISSVFIVVHPHCQALPVPPTGIALGRGWFKAQGCPDGEISSNHFSVTRKGRDLYMEDLGSKNGIFLNGNRLPAHAPTIFRDGSVLRLGGTVLVYREHLMGDLSSAKPVGRMVGPFGLRHVQETLDMFASHPPLNVLLRGETGTGKELAAEAIADALGRPKPYAAVSVADVASGVFESQFFGHVAGAFSNAKGSAKGIVMAHNGGTVFLDEIGELPLELQPKFLRLLENRELLPVGASEANSVDVGIVAGTHRDLRQMVQEGSFRQDLYARLAMAEVELPALRHRAEDIVSIFQRIAPEAGLQIAPESMEPEAIESLLMHTWRNNVRELYAFCTRLKGVDASGTLRRWAVLEVLEAFSPSEGSPPTEKPTVQQNNAPPVELTPDLVRSALNQFHSNQSEVARHLGVSRGKLRRFMEKHNLGG